MRRRLRGPMNANVIVTIDGKSVEIARRSWQVMMTAVKYLVDSGDMFLLFGDLISEEEMQAAREETGELYLWDRPAVS